MVVSSVYAATTYNVNSTTNFGANANFSSEHNYQDKKIAFIEPTFTYAAYQNGSFYNFYDKYSPLRFETDNATITADLHLLKDRPIPHGPFPYYAHPTYKDVPYIDYFNTLLQHIKNTNASVTRLTDVDVDQGKIFQSDGKNAYDILFLFHQEYLTQTEYNNLRAFVNNGGTIVFTDANILYAEVSYNKNTDSITLVSGHNWKFDGKTAQNGLSERWTNENKEWMGSNFLDIPSNYNVYFRNNVFNYVHTEEQYVANPKAKILIDYLAYNLTDSFPNATVATYMMPYGKGNVINLGIWGHTLTNNLQFIKYFDNVIVPLAIDLSTPKDNNVSKSPSPSSETSNLSLRSIVKKMIDGLTPTCNNSAESLFKIDQIKIQCTNKKNASNDQVIVSFIVPLASAEKNSSNKSK